eukprot:scaffold375556_cov36-Prasinocladus_malaysianus.AAC.1
MMFKRTGSGRCTKVTVGKEAMHLKHKITPIYVPTRTSVVSLMSAIVQLSRASIYLAAEADEATWPKRAHRLNDVELLFGPWGQPSLSYTVLQCDRWTPNWPSEGRPPHDCPAAGAERIVDLSHAERKPAVRLMPPITPAE